MDSISLQELASRIRGAIETLETEFWVVAEVAQANLNRRSGHCYLDLVDKREDELLAQMRATIWKWAFQKISAKFSLATGSDIVAGMKVLLLVEVRFHEIYGLSLNIKDIDPAYTLGDMARKRRETMERLEKEGIFNKNKQVQLALLPYSIAVVTSETAAGYGDFLNTLKAGGYGFSITLYPAFMQGDRTEESVISALRAIAKKTGDYDAVAVIRGGGSQVDLSYFDSYALAREIALFPIPVLAGIGHERDESVAGMVAHTRLITPTAVAEFLVGRLEEFSALVGLLAGRLVARTRALLTEEGHRLRHLALALVSECRALLLEADNLLSVHGRGLASSARSFLTACRHRLAMGAGEFKHMAHAAIKGESSRVEAIQVKLPKDTVRFIKAAMEKLDSARAKLRLMDPLNVLRRGYSITTKGGRAVTDSDTLEQGDVLFTRFAKGEATSVVERTGKERNG